TKEALSFGAGYALAEDRLWQADRSRRQATGRLAEIGVGDLDYDLFIRTIGYTKQETTAIISNMSLEVKQMILAYTDGINQYIDEAISNPSEKMPFEYLQRGIIPEPWTIEDSLAIGQMMVRMWGQGGGNEPLFLYALSLIIQQNGILKGWKQFNDIAPQYDPGSDTTLNWTANVSTMPLEGFPFFLSADLIKLCEQIVVQKTDHKAMSEKLGLYHYFGSNGWVVAPWKSDSGNPLLLGGPQMGHSIPQIVAEIGLHGAGINASGMTFPGVGPFIAIGVSEWGAWTTTSGLSDGVDTYIEILHPIHPNKYWYKYRWHEMDQRTEIIYDKNGTAHEYVCYRTIHGPVIGSQWSPFVGGVALSQKMAFWKAEHHTLEGVITFQECHNIEEFEEGVAQIVSSHNWFWADRNGDIGYYHAGWYPIRQTNGWLHRSIDDRFPLIGTGKEEWISIVPFDQLPQDRNPSDGFYANWNNKPQKDWPHAEAEIGPMWGEGHIVVRIQELLAADNNVTFDDMIAICRNVAYHDAYGTYFKPYLLTAIYETGGISPEITSALEGWDCYYNNENNDSYYDDPGLTIFTEWFNDLFNVILLDEFPDELVREFSHSLLLHILQGDASKLPLRYKNYLDGKTINEAIITALNNAITTLINEFGTTNISLWLTPVDMDGFSEIGALPSPQMPDMNRGTYNQIAEIPLNPSEMVHAVNVLPPGQNGFVNATGLPPPHSYDQLPLYIKWNFKPMHIN
ncbi:MAG: penicillin acylase family protein, partial [Candidatus Thermoplasmatota archaeon]|nr:penicillin acylase family protein [Candidatus Thermoplasmatota archaeon]